MGGGTSIIEGIMLGRRMVGIDLNALAHFVTSVRTRPLSPTDADTLRTWASKAGADRCPGQDDVLNLPASVRRFLSGEIAAAEDLRFPRQEAFARCALLRLGQWALDCRDVSAPGHGKLRRKLSELVDEMLAGLDEFVDKCQVAGISKREISQNRLLFWVMLRRLHAGKHSSRAETKCVWFSRRLRIQAFTSCITDGKCKGVKKPQRRTGSLKYQTAISRATTQVAVGARPASNATFR